MLRSHLIAFAMLVTLSATFASADSSATRPNIVILFADDLGYGDLGCYGSKKIKTPHLDQMAAEGRKFTSFVLPASVCTPSRAALLTGCYPKRVGLHKHVLFPQSKTGLNPQEYTLAEHFREAGYATACIGKWHLGHYPETLPRAHGFDSYYGIPYSNDMHHPTNQAKQKPPRRDASWSNLGQAVTKWQTPLIENEAIIELPADQRTITRRYTDRAIAFVNENIDRPFFLYAPHSMPHVPLFVPDDAYDSNPQNAFTCVIEHLDAEIGRLLEAIREQGLAERTIVIFTSDNGPWLNYKTHGGSAGPLREGKATPYEGGHRVPCIVWAAGRVAAGSESDAFVSSLDLMPSLASLIERPLPSKKTDGLDTSGAFFGNESSPRPELVYYHANGNLAGIRRGNWKLLFRARNNQQQQNPQLFNLSEDVVETNNLSAERPELVKELSQLAIDRDAEITANARPVWNAKAPHPWPDEPDLR